MSIKNLSLLLSFFQLLIVSEISIKEDKIVELTFISNDLVIVYAQDFIKTLHTLVFDETNLLYKSHVKSS